MPKESQGTRNVPVLRPVCRGYCGKERTLPMPAGTGSQSAGVTWLIIIFRHEPDFFPLTIGRVAVPTRARRCLQGCDRGKVPSRRLHYRHNCPAGRESDDRKLPSIAIAPPFFDTKKNPPQFPAIPGSLTFWYTGMRTDRRQE